MEKVTTPAKEVQPSPKVELLTKREYLAGLIVSGLAASGKYDGHERVAHEGIKIADALIRQLEEVK